MKKLILICSLFLAGCLFSGGGNTMSPVATISKVAWSSYYAKAASDLPSCDSDRQDQIWYVEATKLFQHCDSFSWKKIDYRSKPAEILQCNKFISYQNGANYERVNLHYESVLYNTNEVRVSCRSNTDSGNDFFSETSSSGYAASFEFNCEVIGDLDLYHPPSGGYDKSGRWQISRSGDVVSVRYVDLGHPLTNTVWNFASNECNKRTVSQ